jgi:glycerophosphoryl diester phosphodiesterase
MKIILAHRGVIEKNKENTLSSLKAIKKYSNTANIKFGVEFDINLTSDLQLVLYHDEYIKETGKKLQI